MCLSNIQGQKGKVLCNFLLRLYEEAILVPYQARLSVFCRENFPRAWIHTIRIYCMTDDKAEKVILIHFFAAHIHKNIGETTHYREGDPKSPRVPSTGDLWGCRDHPFVPDSGSPRWEPDAVAPRPFHLGNLPHINPQVVEDKI